MKTKGLEALINGEIVKVSVDSDMGSDGLTRNTITISWKHNHKPDYFLDMVAENSVGMPEMAIIQMGKYLEEKINEQK